RTRFRAVVPGRYAGGPDANGTRLMLVCLRRRPPAASQDERTTLGASHPDTFHQASRSRAPSSRPPVRKARSEGLPIPRFDNRLWIEETRGGERGCPKVYVHVRFTPFF